MSRAHVIAAAPGALLTLGALELTPAHAAVFSGIMGGLWFAVQIGLALEKRWRERRAERAHHRRK